MRVVLTPKILIILSKIVQVLFFKAQSKILETVR